MKIKFITFRPVYGGIYGAVVKDATTVLNEWLQENPKIEIINWQTLPTRELDEFYITIQYKEN